MSIKAHARELFMDTRVELFDIDLTSVGGPVQRIAPMSNVIQSTQVARLTNASGSAGYLGYDADDTEDSLEDTAKTNVVRVLFKRTSENVTHQIRIGGASEVATLDFESDTALESDSAVTGAGLSSGAFDFYVAPVSTLYGVAVIIGPGHADATAVRIAQAEAMTEVLDVVRIDYWAFGADEVLESVDSVSDFALWSVSGATTRTLEPFTDAFAQIPWRGNLYSPTPVEADGFEISSEGQLPRPKMQVSNVLGFATALISTYGDLTGCLVTRWVTYRRFLDDGAKADPNAHLPIEQYTIDRLASKNKAGAQWELSSVLDQQGVKLPGRQVLRTGCQFLYRTYDGSDFDYSGVDCPYVGSNMFKSDDTSTSDETLDACSHTLSGCLLRFPSGEVPFGGFPGAGRLTR